MSQNISLTIELNVDCPHCGETQDLAKSEFNPEGEYLSAIFSESHDWRKEVEGRKFECPDCKKEFELGEIEW